MLFNRGLLQSKCITTPSLNMGSDKMYLCSTIWLDYELSTRSQEPGEIEVFWAKVQYYYYFIFFTKCCLLKIKIKYLKVKLNVYIQCTYLEMRLIFLLLIRQCPLPDVCLESMTFQFEVSSHSVTITPNMSELRSSPFDKPWLIPLCVAFKRTS